MTDETSTDKFEGARFYDARDNEQLTHETPEEAIIELLEINLDPRDEGNFNLESALADLCPVAVDAYVPDEVSDGELDSEAEYLADQLGEWWDEEWGDPDGDATEASPAVKAKLREALELFRSESRVWPCKQVASRSYSLEEVKKIWEEHTQEGGS